MGAEPGDCTDGHHGNMGEDQPTVQGLGFMLHQLEQSEFPCGTLNKHILCPSQHQFEAVLMLVLRERQ